MRISRKLSLAAAIIVLTMLAGATPALAETHPFLFSFGSFTNPNGIAVEEATGDVYVADIGTDTVSKFDATGSPVDFAALGTNQLTGVATPAKSFSFPSEPHNPAAVAVDNSRSPADPSTGDLYVMDAGHAAIDKFNAKGEYLGQIAGPYLSETATLTSGPPLGFAVEAGGDIRVASKTTGGGAWDLFDDTAANNLLSTQHKVAGIPFFHGLAVGPNGESYALEASSEFPASGCGCWVKWGGSLTGGFPYIFSDDGRVDGGPGAVTPGGVAATVDPVSGHLFVDDQSSVVEWDTGGMNGLARNPKNINEVFGSAALVTSFGGSQLSSSKGQQGGIAVDGANGEIYVSNPADGKVYVFGSSVPAVAAGVASDVSRTAATLHGSVDPWGVPVTKCEFEYEKAPETFEGHERVLTMPVRVFSHRVPCIQEAGGIGVGHESGGSVGGCRGS